MTSKRTARAGLLAAMVVFLIWLLLWARFPVKCDGGDCVTRPGGWAWWER